MTKPPTPVGDSQYEALDPQSIEVIESLWGIAPHLANVVKYVARAPFKPHGACMRDLRKAEWYLTRALTMVKYHIALTRAEHEADRQLAFAEHTQHVADSYSNPTEANCPHCGLPPGVCPGE